MAKIYEFPKEYFMEMKPKKAYLLAFIDTRRLDCGFSRFGNHILSSELFYSKKALFLALSKKMTLKSNLDSSKLWFNTEADSFTIQEITINVPVFGCRIVDDLPF